MPLRPPILAAWIASATAFALAFVVWAFITTKFEGSLLPSKTYFRVFLFALSIGLIGQLAYGALLYLALKRLDLLSLPIILLAYPVPVLLFSWHASDTTNDVLGTIPLVAFALIVGFVSWFLAGAGTTNNIRGAIAWVVFALIVGLVLWFYSAAT